MRPNALRELLNQGKPAYGRGMQLLCYSSDINFLRSGAASGINWLQKHAV